VTSSRKALLTGLSGQDGSYLAEYLLHLGYRVAGLVRRVSNGPSPRVARLARLGVQVVEGDLLDQGSLIRALEASAPDEVYHLAAQSFVGRSWNEPLYTLEVIASGTARLLEAVRQVRPQARFYQASSSEMFGAAEGRATLDTPLRPRSPYGVAKLAAHELARTYREAHGLFVARGVLFNHESPRRGPEFVTKKIAQAAARIAAGDRQPLALGRLDARRDWGWAPDYVVAMHQLLQRPEPTDLLLGTGEARSVAEFAALAFAAVGLDWRDHVVRQASLLRPAEIPCLVADPSAAAAALGWTPQVAFPELVRRMVAAEQDPGSIEAPPWPLPQPNSSG
jgi:GDPmannose 4,6-dehydratase